MLRFDCINPINPDYCLSINCDIITIIFTEILIYILKSDSGG